MPVLHETTFEDFVATRSPRLLHLAYLLTRDRGQAEDLLQTALARAWPMWDRIRSDPEAYDRRILINTSSAWWRRKWNGEVPTERLPERAAADPHHGVDDRHEMFAALRRLPRQQRVVVILRYYEDLSEEDIADALGISPGTVKSHAHKALAALRLDATLAESTLQPAGPLPPITVSAVQRAIALRRRRRLTVVTAACIVVVAIILGYALGPHRRTAPPTHPSPTPWSTAYYPWPEYDSGTRMQAIASVTVGHPATLRWTAGREGAVVKLRCDGLRRELIARVRFHIAGSEPWLGGCTSSYGSVDGSIGADRLAAAGIAAGDSAEVTVELLDVAFDGNIADREKRRVALPPGTTLVAGLAITIPWEEYPFPAKPDVISTSPFQGGILGPPAMTSGKDPMRRRETTVAWGKNYWMLIHGRGPVELRILVAGQPFATCKTWWYSKSDCNYDIAPHHPELPREPTAGEPVKVTVIPVHAEELWEVWFQESAMAPPSRAAVDLT